MKRTGAPLLAVLLLGGCQQGPGPVEGSGGGPHPAARALIEQGDYDGALAELAGDSDADALYLMGQAWVGKAGGARRTENGRLGPEEMQALDLFQQAVAARADYGAAHLAVAELLAPYAIIAKAGSTGRGDAASGAGGPVVTVERVLAAYAAAVQADPADTEAPNRLIEFALKAGRPQDAAAGFEELTRRDRENPDLLVRYGDFLAGPGGNPEEAEGVYAQALIWRPDDAATHLKIADLHIDAAREHLKVNHYAAAEAELREARKHVVDPGSPQARRLQDAARALADASGRQ
jgi:tetratricopeptide (TPR) repeat protein